LNLVESAGYPGLFFVMVLGNIGLPVGTEIVVPAAGALAATGHLSSWWLAGLVATAGEIVGGTLLYAVGFIGGRPFVQRWGKYIKLSEKKLDQFHDFYDRYGNGVVFVCRFLPVIRGVSALPAGVSRMQKRYFLIYTLLGSAMFCFGLSWLGSTVAHHIDSITPLIHRSTTIAIVVIVLAVAAFVAFRFSRSRPGQGLA
jgi:membrane protein DedA with SNARE-associated domain